MEGKVIQVILSSEAENFVRLQSLKTQQKIAYNIRNFCLLGYRQTNFSGSHSRYNKENLKDSKERDRKGRIYKKRIF